ncbi:hypothetical protein ACA910_015149 [Epithemia clementina (nom. ined.)]
MTNKEVVPAYEKATDNEEASTNYHKTLKSKELELQPLRRQSTSDDDSAYGLRSSDDDEEDGVGYVEDGTGNGVSEKTASGDYLLPGWLDRMLFPPHLPRACQLLRPENIAVPACYLLVGLLQGLSGSIIGVLPLDLQASEAQQTTFMAIRSLPASFKIAFGFLSDNCPIAGYRRKPYMMAGWLIASLSMASLLFFSNLDVVTRGSCFASTKRVETAADSAANGDESLENVVAVVNKPIPDDAPSIPFLAVSILIFGLGFWMADVMGDSIVAEKAKLEPPNSRGSIQSSCYSFRFGAAMVASPLSTFVYSTYGPGYVIMLLSILPLCILPAIYSLEEVANAPIRSTRQQCQEIWNTVCSRAAWQPMGFVFLYNLLQVSNSAWKEFQRTVLGFTSCQFNLISNVAYVLLFMGILSYKYHFIKYSWRSVYIWTTALNGLFSALQVLLIYGFTFGLPNFVFALGDDAFAEFVVGIQFLPATIMMVHLCPEGSEGASYAMFTTMSNCAGAVSTAFSTFLLKIWDTDKATLAAGKLSGLANLTYLTTAIQMSGVLFVGWLPHTKDGLVELAAMGKSKIGGFVFLSVLFLAISYAIFVGLMNIIAPGWMGES